MKTYFVDTNYFLRLLIKDNNKQFKIAYAFFKKASEYQINTLTSTVVIFEIFWVLSSFYQKQKNQVVSLLKNILKVDFVEIEHRQTLIEALELYSHYSLDFEDCYYIIFAKNLSANFASFDKRIHRIMALPNKKWSTIALINHC